MQTVYGKECLEMPHDKAMSIQCIVSELYQFHAHAKALSNEESGIKYCDCMTHMPNLNTKTCQWIVQYAHALLAHRWIGAEDCPKPIQDQLSQSHSPLRGKCESSLNMLQCLV